MLEGTLFGSVYDFIKMAWVILMSEVKKWSKVTDLEYVSWLSLMRDLNKLQANRLKHIPPAMSCYLIMPGVFTVLFTQQTKRLIAVCFTRLVTWHLTWWVTDLIPDLVERAGYYWAVQSWVACSARIPAGSECLLRYPVDQQAGTAALERFLGFLE